jgi:hypothetical protein
MRGQLWAAFWFWISGWTASSTIHQAYCNNLEMMQIVLGCGAVVISGVLALASAPPQPRT